MTDAHSPIRIIRNVLSNWGAFVLSAVIGFVLSPFIVRSLGTTGYGTWVLLNSAVGYLGLLDLGVRSAVTRYVARFHASGDHTSAGKLTSAALGVFGVLALTTITVAVVLALVIEQLFHLPAELVYTARVVAVVSGASIAVSLIAGVFGGVLVGIQRFDYLNLGEVSVEVLRTSGVVVVLRSGWGLIGLALVQLSASLLRLGIQYRLSRRLYPQLGVRVRGIERSFVRLVLGFGLTSSVLHVAGQVMMYGDSVIISALLPVGFVTYFAIAANLTSYARSLVGGVSSLVTPMTSALDASGDQAALRRSLVASARLTTTFILPIVATFIVRGRTFIALWMGPTYAELSGQILAILAVVVACHTGYQVTTTAMIGLNRHRGLIPIFLGDALANALLSILLVNAIGVIGSAVGTLIPQLVVTLVIAPWYLRRHVGVPMREFWWNTHFRPTLAVLPFAVVSIAFERWWEPTGISYFFLQVILALPAAIVGAWVFALDPGERRIAAAGARRQSQ